MISIEFVLSVAATPDADPSLFRPLLDWFNLDDPWRKWLVAFGLLGQAVFVARWIIQWAASERVGRSHVPELFWRLTRTISSLPQPGTDTPSALHVSAVPPSP